MELWTRARVAMESPNPYRRASDFILAKMLRSLPYSWREHWFKGDQYFCPICESHLRKFLVLHRAHHLWCGVCWSLQRHRLIWLFFQKQIFPWLDSTPKRILHIAPEPGISTKLAALPGAHYLSADLFMPEAMVRMDICNIEYSDESFDLIYCSHVLEHVADDRQAIREFYRVLANRGRAVILVPIIAEQTFEDPTIVDPRERERVYGQHDHVRAYGPDFRQRLEQAGFQVSESHRADLANTLESQQMGIDCDETIFLCEKPAST